MAHTWQTGETITAANLNALAAVANGTHGTPTGDALKAAYVSVVSPSGDTSGATDTAAINAILGANGFARLKPGDYYVNGTLNLGFLGGIIGAGQQNSKIHWAGANGGKVIATATLASASDVGWFGVLSDFRVIYPVASMANGSRGIYIAQPHGRISGVAVDTGESVPATSVAGTYGLDLDGCGNPGGPFPVDITVLGRWKAGVYARCNHAALSVGFGYGDWGVMVGADSVNSSAGPPYNLAISVHTFYANAGSVDVVKCNSVRVLGGLTEGTGVGLQIENGAGGLVQASGLTTTSGSHLKHYDPGCVVTVDNPQTQDRNRYTGTATTGVLVPLTRQVTNRQTATVTAAGTTTGPTVVGWLGPVKNGPLGRFDCTYLGTAMSNTTGQDWTVGIYQCSSQPTNGSALPGGSSAVISQANAGSQANVPGAVALGSELTGQNTTCWFAVTVSVTGGGAAVGQSTGRLVIEAA